MAFWRGEHVVCTAQRGWVLPRRTELKWWVLWRAFSPGSWFYRTAVLMLSASSSCGPSPLAHTEGFRRISTPKEGMKGSGASVQGSARGLTFDLLSSTNWRALMYYFERASLRPCKPELVSLSSAIYSHAKTPLRSALVWVTWVCGFLCEQQVTPVWFWLGRRKAHGVVICVQRRRTKQRPYLLVVKKNKGKGGFCYWIIILWTDQC